MVYPVNQIKLPRAELELIFNRNNKTELIDLHEDPIVFSPEAQEVFEDYLCNEDYNSVGCPVLARATLKDPVKGSHFVADFEVPEDQVESFVSVQLNDTLYACDPKTVIQRQSVVAIDFGTSSTVVAIKKPGGETKLIRLGIEDHTKEAQANEFENPTLFQIRQNELLKEHGPWQEIECRPSISMLYGVRYANLAKESIRDMLTANLDATEKLNFMHSVVGLLKTSLQAQKDTHDLRRDEQGNDPLEINYGLDESSTVFDAVEYYAWLIGRNLNNNDLGYYPKYLLSYPVKFTAEQKQKYVTSFARGLLRSVPASVRYSPVFQKKFNVELFKPEPIAFAASVLGLEGGVELSDEVANQGQMFAIFDVGGGTSDFFFGNYRTSSGMDDEEYDDFVLEDYRNDGIATFGGEHLLHKICWEIILENSEFFRLNQIEVIRPKGAKSNLDLDYLTSDQSTYGELNIATLKEQFINLLLLEAGTDAWNLDTDVSLISKTGEHKVFKISIPYQKIFELLSAQFVEAVKHFLVALRETVEAQNRNIPAVTLIRSGNTCRSAFLRKIFDPNYELELAAGIPDAIKDIITEQINNLSSLDELFRAAYEGIQPKFFIPQLHLMPLLDQRLPEAINPIPNIKTGTALGLLKLIPGEGLLHIESGSNRFGYHLGRKQREEFICCIQRNHDLNNQDWVRVSRYNGSFTIYYSTSAKDTDLELAECNVVTVLIDDFDEDDFENGMGFLWVRPISANEVEFAVTEKKTIEPDENSIRQRYSLS